MIHSPAIGVGYFFWRRLRWPLAGVLANVALLAVLARVFAHAEFLPAVVFCTLLPLVIVCIHLLGVFTYGPTDFGAATSGFPRYMMVHPARARSLVGWPMFYGALTVTVLCVLTFLAVSAPTQFQIPAGIFAGFFIASLAWFQVSAWIAFPFPVLRGIFAFLAMFVLTCGGICTHLHGFSEMFVTGGYLLAALLAYGVGVLGVSRARRGEGQTWTLAPLVERWLGYRSRRGSFASARRAQLWHELRRGALYLPGMTLFMCVPMLLPLLGRQAHPLFIGGYTISGRMLSMSMMLATPLFMSGAFSIALGKFDFWSNMAPTFTAFFATRGFGTNEFVLVKWLSAAVSTLIVGAILLLFIAIFALSSTAAERAQIAGLFGPSPAVAIGRMALIFLLLLFTIWRNQVIDFFIPMLGRAWFTMTLSLLGWSQFIVLAIIGAWMHSVPEIRPRLISLVPGVIYAVAVIKLVMAGVIFRILRQREIVSASFGKRALVVLGAVGVALMASLCALIEPRFILIPTAILMLPMNRLALAPLTLRANRHR